jgi:hypothetical protein
MILNDSYSDQPRFHGKILLSVIMLAFAFLTFVIFMAYGFSVTHVSSREYSLLAPQSQSKKIKAETQVGVVKGITYSPLSPCALINETIVHPGDTIHKVTVVQIQNDAVMFAKGNLIWLQKVLDPPNPAWPKIVN